MTHPETPLSKISPRRTAKSAARNYKVSMSSNANIQPNEDLLSKKKQLNEHYSFLLGKLDRSKSNVRGTKAKGLGDYSVDHAYGKISNTSLPSMITSRNPSKTPSIYKTVDVSNKSPKRSIPKINILAPLDSTRNSRSSVRNAANHTIDTTNIKSKKSEMADSYNDREETMPKNNKSIRRVMDIDHTAINIPDFKIDINQNSDDILKQFKDNLKNN